jgi:low temperature requirement protein LtrA
VDTDHGTWLADAVINATGTWTNPVLPRYPGADRFAGRQLHTYQYGSAEEFAGHRVAIVGGGISAVQQLEEISRFATTFWYTRREPVFLDHDFEPETTGRETIERVTADAEAGKPTGSIVSYTGLGWSPYAIAARDRGVLERRPMFTGIEPNGVREADGSFTSVDVILWISGRARAPGPARPAQSTGRDRSARHEGCARTPAPPDRLRPVTVDRGRQPRGASRSGRHSEVARRVDSIGSAGPSTLVRARDVRRSGSRRRWDNDGVRMISRRVTAPEADAPVTMLELFFDLVFVFVVTQLAGLVGASSSWVGYAHAALVLLVTWWIYDGFVWLSNNVTPTTTATRVPMLIAMTCFLAMASSVTTVFGASAWVFATAYLVVVAIHAFQFSRSSLGVSSRGIRRIAPVNFGVAVLLFVAAALGTAWGWTAWLAAILLLVIAGLRRFSYFTLRAEHFAERHRLLIIIALGETVVAIGVAANGRLLQLEVLATFLVAMVVIITLWWTYFGVGDDERGLRRVETAAPDIQTGLASRAYSLWHVLHIAGLVLVAVALDDILRDSGRPLPWSAAVAFGAGLALFMVAQALFRRTLTIGSGRLHLATAIAMLALAPLGAFVTGFAQLAVSGGVLVAFVVILQRKRMQDDRTVAERASVGSS